MSKRVFLVTGASGFVGACLVRRLITAGEEVHLLLRKGHKSWRLADLKDKFFEHESDLSSLVDLCRLVNDIKPTVIYHLAAYGAYSSQNDPQQCIETNIQGTWNLLKATAEINYELFVNTGSSSEYGYKKLPMKESDLLEPASYYAVTKASQTMLCSYFAVQNKKPVVTIRPFSVYGPYEDGARFMPTLLMSLLNQNEMNLVSPDIARDWIYSDDMVDAFLLIDALKRYGGQAFNIGTGLQTSIRDIAGLAVEVTGQTPHYKWGGMPDRAWDTNFWVADTEKSARLLNWRAQVCLKDGIGRMWDWIRENRHLYV